MAEKTNSYQDYQDAQSQLLNIQAQQQANLQEARLMGQSQMATNNTLNQAAQVAAQTVAMGNTTQHVTLNPTTQAVLQQYGLGQPRVVRNQSRNQSTTPQHITVNNNTSNITNNNVSVPANIGGPLQGRPIQINPDIQMGTFKTWLSNVFAQQNAEAARRDREYEKRESALNRNSNKLLKKIGEIGGNIGKALDPRRATNSSVNTVKTLFKVLGIAKLAQNWDVIAEKLDGLFNFFKGKSKGEDDEPGKSFFTRMRETFVHLLGGQSEGDSAEGVLIALRRLFYTKDGEDSANGKGIFNLVLDRIKLELKHRFTAATAAAKTYREENPSSGDPLGIGKAMDRLIGAVGAILESFITGDSSAVVNKKMQNEVDPALSPNLEESLGNLREPFYIATMGREKSMENVAANLSYGNNQVKFSYNDSGKVISLNKDLEGVEIDPNDVRIGNIMDFGARATAESESRFDKKEYLDEDGNINISDGDLLGVYLASRDAAIKLLKAYSSESSNFGGLIKAALVRIKQIDKVLKDKKIDKVPVHDDFVSLLATSAHIDKLEKRRFKLILSKRFRSDEVAAPMKIAIKKSNTINTNYTFILVPSINERDIGDDGLTHQLYVMSKEDLINIVNIYTNTEESNKVYDLQSNQFSINFARTAYNNTENRIRSKSETQQALQELEDLFDVDYMDQYMEDLNQWQNDVDNSRVMQASNNISETDFFKYLKEHTADARGMITGAIEQLTGNAFQKKSEFIQKLYDPLNKILLEEFPEMDEDARERYTNLLLSQLALESGWGKHLSGNNNFGGIKAPKKSDGTPVDEEHAQEYWTKEILNGGPRDYPNLVNRARPGFPYQMSSNKWMWVIKDYFKTYDSPEEFLKDYVQKLKNNWPDAMNGINEYESNLPKYFAIKLKNDGVRPYYTADEDQYGQTLKSLYETITETREKMKSNQNIIDDEILDENQNSQSEESEGISQVRMGSITDNAGGEGDGEYSIPTYNNPYNNEGDESVEPYYSGNSGDNTKTYNNIVPNDEKFNTLDINKAVQNLRENAHWEIDASGKRIRHRDNPNKGYHMCARHVMVALRTGGINISGINHASQFLDDQSINPRTGKVIAGKKDGIALINEDGFQEIEPGNFQPGDVSVEEAVNPYGSGKENTMGHMAMWDGNQWISDFIQRDKMGKVHPNAPGKIHYFRYVGRKVNDGIVSGSYSSSDLGQYKKEFEDDLLSRFTTALNDFTARSRESNIENQNIGQGDSSNSEDYKEILSMLAQILNSQNSIAFNTAATADEVRANTEVTAQQINRPIEKRTPTNSMMSSRSSGNYGG